MSPRRREPEGTPAGGRFAQAPRAEGDVTLGRAAEPLPYGYGSLDPVAAGLPEVRPADWDPFESANDAFVDSVHNGQLARSIVKGPQYMTARAWQQWAVQRSRETGLEDPEAAAKYDDFAKGVEHAVIALMSDKSEVAPTYVVSRILWPMGSHPRASDHQRARALLTFKRTSRASRSEWATQAGDAPSEAGRRGFLTAAAALSGTDAWWGLRENPDAAVGT